MGYDGPSTEITSAALALAEATKTSAIRALAVAEADTSRARELLQRSNEGLEDAGSALDMLATHQIPAVGLLDAVEFDDVGQREIEPLLWPYRDAVVVDPARLDAALDALKGLPWAVVISNEPTSPPDGVITAPPSAARFIAAVAERARSYENPHRVSDEAAGVTVIGGTSPLAGRNARVKAAENRLNDTVAEEQQARTSCEDAHLIAADRAAEHEQAVAAEALSHARADLERAEHTLEQHNVGERTASDEQICLEQIERDLDVQLKGLEAARARAQQDLDDTRKALNEHGRLIAGLVVDLRARTDFAEKAALDWVRGEAAARERCTEDPRDAGGLRNRANETLHEALYSIGMRAGEDAAPTSDLLNAWRRKAQDDGLPFPVLADPLAEYLSDMSERDLVLNEQIAEARAQTHDALGAAEIEVGNARTALGRIQDAIQRDIEIAINKIGDQFNVLDGEAGGHGAELTLTMRPPANAADDWHWSVTPMWRRSPGGRMVPYTAPTNSAQDKLYTVNLVLAALLAVPYPEGRVLILDELGDSLGFQHRRDVLRAIAQTAHDNGITVLGTCQDDVLHHAAEFTQQIVFFEYNDHRDVLNRPVRLFGFDPNGHRIEMHREAVLAGRPVV